MDKSIEAISTLDFDKRGQTCVFGTTQRGKTKLYENLIKQDIKKYYEAVDDLVESVVTVVQTAYKDPFFRNVSKEVATAVLSADIIIALENGQIPLIDIDALRVGVRWPSLQEKVEALSKIDTPAAERAAGRLQDILKDSSQEYYHLITWRMYAILKERSSENNDHQRWFD